MKDFSCSLAGLVLEHPIFNAAGTVKMLEEVRTLSRSAAAMIMVGSITVEPREGNPGDVYWSGPHWTLNSLGLPNPGLPYYQSNLAEMVTIAHDAGKPLGVSVVGFKPVEYAALADIALTLGADLVELNFGCPNVWEKTGQHRIISFDIDSIAHVLSVVTSAVGRRSRVSVKLSPFSDPEAMQTSMEELGSFAMVKAVTAINTFPNTLDFDPHGVPRISRWVAGMSGPALLPIGLGQVWQLHNHLKPGLQIIGVGGVTHGSDVVDYLQAGATAVGVATAYLNRGPGVFTELLTEMVNLPPRFRPEGKNE